MSISSASELRSSLINPAVSDTIDREGDKRRWPEGWGWRLFEGGDYFKFFRLRVAVIRLKRSIEGRGTASNRDKVWKNAAAS